VCPRCSSERMPTDRASTDVNEPSEPAETTPQEPASRRKPRLSTPRTRTCPWGPRLSTPRTKTCPRDPGPPPHGRRPVRGTPALHPTDEDLSAGPRARRRAEQVCARVSGGSRFALGGLRHSRTAGNDRRARGRAALGQAARGLLAGHTLSFGADFGGYMDSEVRFQVPMVVDRNKINQHKDFTYWIRRSHCPPSRSSNSFLRSSP